MQIQLYTMRAVKSKKKQVYQSHTSAEALS